MNETLPVIPAFPTAEEVSTELRNIYPIVGYATVRDVEYARRIHNRAAKPARELVAHYEKQNAALKSQVERAAEIIDEQARVIQQFRQKDPQQLELCLEVIETRTVQLNCFARIS